jgi:uncharacterized protein
MCDETLETYIRQLLESQRAPEVTIAWQGGEPTLMGLDFFKCAVNLVHTFARPGVDIQHTMQTNSILLNDDWCRFFHEQRFLIGLSLDGPQAMHDTYRVDKGGAPKFQKVLRAVRLLQEHKVEFNILTTVNAANADHPLEVYRFLRDEVGTQFVQFIPIVERINERGEIGFQEGSQVSERSVKPEQWGTFLITIFGECPKNRFIETPDGESGLNYLCAGYKTFFTHIDKPKRIMAELLRRDRAPAEVKLVLEAEEAQL